MYVVVQLTNMLQENHTQASIYELLVATLCRNMVRCDCAAQTVPEKQLTEMQQDSGAASIQQRNCTGIVVQHNEQDKS